MNKIGLLGIGLKTYKEGVTKLILLNRVNFTTS